MIKIALKHWIYEKCIDVLFKYISKNFLISREQNEFKVRDKFEYIILKPHITDDRLSFRMYNCTILENKHETLLLEFSNSEYFNYNDNYTCKTSVTRCGANIHNVDTYRRK